MANPKKNTMHQHAYLYSLKYDIHNTELCKLECRQVFGHETDAKVLLSDTEIDPSISPFLKNRLQIITCANTYEQFLESMEQEGICIENFKIEYLKLDGDTTGFQESRTILHDVGYKIEGIPNFKTPSVTYAVCNSGGVWYFGVLTKHNADWYQHKDKPCSFSNSIGMDIAKSLVGIATRGNKNNNLLDGCCGVGTVMLEACCAGFRIEGCDISENACKHTRKNLEHYKYTAQVHHTDIKELQDKYDATIIDLPYNLYTYSTDSIAASIIDSAAKLSARVVVVSIADITSFITQAGLQISDYCTVEKKGKSKFRRSIWVCERMS